MNDCIWLINTERADAGLWYKLEWYFLFLLLMEPSPKHVEEKSIQQNSGNSILT